MLFHTVTHRYISLRTVTSQSDVILEAADPLVEIKALSLKLDSRLGAIEKDMAWLKAQFGNGVPSTTPLTKAALTPRTDAMAC